MKRVKSILSGGFAALLIVVSLAPFCYVLLQSFWQEGRGITLKAYYDVFLKSNQYLLVFWKSLGICGAIAAGQMIVSVMAGFAFGKCQFKGKGVLFFLLMVLMVMPLQVTLVPNYITLDALRLLNNPAALILPAVFAPLGTFILTQSFQSIPDEILDAAQLDGCGLPRLLLRIAVPMNWNGLVCVLLLSFLDGWNMVEQPIIYLKDFSQYPLSVALAYAPPGGAGIQLACCVLAILPPLFLFTCFNKELVEGIALGEVK